MNTRQYYTLVIWMFLYRCLKITTSLLYFYFAPFFVTFILFIQGFYYVKPMEFLPKAEPAKL